MSPYIYGNWSTPQSIAVPGAAFDGTDYRVTAKVEVADHQGFLVDLTNFFISGSYHSAIDAATDTLTVVFSREDDWGGVGGITGSLAPLMSANPPLDLGRLLVFSLAITPLDIAPAPGDFLERFRGHIDRINWPTRSARVEVHCRDLGGKLLDTFIEKERDYGRDPAVFLTPVESVIAFMLQDNQTGVSLHVPTPSGSFVPPFVQDEMSVMEAIRRMADTIGWVVRYRYIGGVSRLTFYNPEREKTTPDHSLDASRYRDLTRMDTEIDDVRTVVRVFYQNRANQTEYVEAVNAAAVAKYGRRTFTIREGSDSPISMASQAQAMADAALSDLSEPLADHEVDTLIMPQVELGDLIAFDPNQVHYSAEQRLAVVTHRWEVSQNTHRSHILTRGKPASGYLRWLARRESDPDRQITVEVHSREFYISEFFGMPMHLRYNIRTGAKVNAIRWSITPAPDGVGTLHFDDVQVQPDSNVTLEPSVSTPPFGGTSVPFERTNRLYVVKIVPYTEWDDGAEGVDGAPVVDRVSASQLLPWPTRGEHAATREWVEANVGPGGGEPNRPIIVSTQPVDPSWNPGVEGALWLQVE
jgi:hypothetical protein